MLFLSIDTVGLMEHQILKWAASLQGWFQALAVRWSSALLYARASAKSFHEQ